MESNEFDPAIKSSLEFVLDHVMECRCACEGTQGEVKPCGKTPMAIAIDADLPESDNLFPACFDCLIEYGNGQRFLPLAEFLNLLAQHNAVIESE